MTEDRAPKWLDVNALTDEQLGELWERIDHASRESARRVVPESRDFLRTLAVEAGSPPSETVKRDVRRSVRELVRACANWCVRWKRSSTTSSTSVGRGLGT